MTPPRANEAGNLQRRRTDRDFDVEPRAEDDLHVGRGILVTMVLGSALWTLLALTIWLIVR
jgi:hypothetical protein